MIRSPNEPAAHWSCRFVAFAAAVALALSPFSGSALSAQEEAPESEGALFLLLPIGAQGTGVARAMTALSGPESVWWNPAGIVPVEENSLLLFRSEDFSGEATALSVLGTRDGLGSAAVSYLLFDFGDVELRDDQGNFLGTVSFRNHLGILTAGTSLIEGLDVGANLKLIQTRVACRGQCTDAGVTSTTYAFDLGGRWTPVPSLVVAGTLAHLGPRLKVFNEEQADPLPSRLRVAIAYEVLHHFVTRPDVSALVALEVEDRLRDPGSPATYLGAEIVAGIDPGLSLRAGYTFGSELQVDGVGVGVGLRYERFEVGIAKSLSSTSLGDDTEPVQITFGFLF
jgi:hypothetical protein